MNLLERIWQFWIFLVSLLSPFQGQRPAFKIAPGLRLFLHGLVIALILVGLYCINVYMPIRGMYIYQHIPHPQWASRYWLPIIFILLYALAVTGWWIYRLLMAEPEATDFPDIDEAWEEAVDALDAAGVSVTEVPIFLVLGRPETPEEHLFQAAQLNLIVKGAPVGARHPLHVYASREGVFITCAGCSLLGKQASLLALEGIGDDAGASGEAPMIGLADDAGATLKPGQAEQKIIKKLARMIGTQMNGLQKRMLRRESNLPMPNLLASNADVELITARMAHVCRLIFRDRQPYCPINGILVLVPLGATDTELDAQQTAELCHLDLSVVRRVMKVQCPIFAMVVDMEQLPGFRDFIHRRTAAERARRIGQRFPLNPPDLRDEGLHDKLGEAVQWLGHNVVRDLIHRVFKTDAGAKLDVNHELFLMLDELRERKDHLARFIVQGLARDIDGPLLFGGCYLAATGAERDKDQAFVRGVLARLFENQNYISWTEQALAEDARCHTATLGGYVVLGVLVALLGTGFGLQWFKR